ncbi:LytR family transcriptional regulator [Clostridioides difficile]|nr:LytR family transcriptional regulator [Clostridioides difficile]
MSGLKKFVIFLALLVIAFPVSIYGYVFTKLKTIQDDSINTEALSSNDYKNEENITNILLLGTDARPGEEVSRSDAMMILTIDNKNKSLKLTSLNRDTYVDIPGRGEQKLTHAYVYGQANLLIETIEENFQLDIQNYAVVDFFSFMDIVDALGGVTVTVDKSEIRELNKFIPETYKWNKNDNTDERDRRQRSVIQSLINGVKDLPVTKYPNLVNTILPYVKTNMNPNEIISLGKELLSIGNLNLKSMEFPLSTENGRKIGNAGYVIPFEEYELDAMHDFIFKDIMVED